MTVAVSFGLASALSVVVLGDESGYLANDDQKMKVAAMESMWETENAPASLTLFGIPDEQTQTTRYAIKIPYALGLIATRSFNTPLLGINELIEDGKARIKDGLIAYNALNALQSDPSNEEAKLRLHSHVNNLGYALLLTHVTHINL